MCLLYQYNDKTRYKSSDIVNVQQFIPRNQNTDNDPRKSMIFRFKEFQVPSFRILMYKNIRHSSYVPRSGRFLYNGIRKRVYNKGGKPSQIWHTWFYSYKNKNPWLRLKVEQKMLCSYVYDGFRSDE